jgi:hypothetical protein
MGVMESISNVISVKSAPSGLNRYSTIIIKEKALMAPQWFKIYSKNVFGTMVVLSNGDVTSGFKRS